MDIFNTNQEDSIHWLKVAMLQAQADIKKNNKRISELELEVKRLSENPKSLITPLDFNGNPFLAK